MDDTSYNKFVKLRTLLSIEGIGPVRVLNLINKFNSIDTIFELSKSDLKDVESINSNLADRIVAGIKNLNSIQKQLDRELEKLEKLNANVILFSDDDYPELLKRIYFPPLILYTLGEFKENDKYAISIVGTRKPTEYGKLEANRFASKLAQQNITIVSGMARGIDSAAHRAALASGGRSIAVIGSGLDVIYPPENRKLFNDIKENGSIVSEFEIGTKPDAQNFPKRNRIISGLSLATILVESRINGGAMRTANYALDQNREVFAIPGDLNKAESDGTNYLIQKNGAKLVREPEDILFDLELKLKPVVGINIPKPSFELSLFEEKILVTIKEEEKQIDKIADDTGLSTADCLVNLLSLEFKGLVRQLPGKVFKSIY
ncbi:MAG: DNA-processing protein DprA [Melioribacteraceae bacterium]|nr:DNA-processing protein DprA [Melioribacteraceae bacterium]